MLINNTNVCTINYLEYTYYSKQPRCYMFILATLDDSTCSVLKLHAMSQTLCHNYNVGM